MNKKRLEILADAVLNNPEHFDMAEGFLIGGIDVYEKKIHLPYFDKVNGKSTFIGDCNTTCCFAGMAIALFFPTLVDISINLLVVSALVALFRNVILPLIEKLEPDNYNV